MPVRVLIVDDEPELRDILNESLTGRGYVTEPAATGVASLPTVRERRPDVRGSWGHARHRSEPRQRSVFTPLAS